MYLGDYTEDYATLNHKFSTRSVEGVPTQLAGSPVVSVYKGSATGTEKTSAETYITLAVDFDSITGLNNVLIDLSGDAFFETGEDYQVIITTGSVDSVNIAGEEIASFSIENRVAGDYVEDYATLNMKFTTRALTGIPTILTGSPVVSVYKGSDPAAEKTSTESYITLEVDFDSITGLNRITIDLSGDAFFETGEDYFIVLTTGTVDGTSVVGETIGTFSIANRFEASIAPAVADVEAGVTFGVGGTEFTGTFASPAEADVESGVTYGAAAEFTGTCAVPAAADVEFGVAVNATTGTFAVPAVADVQLSVDFGAAAEFTGTFVSPAVTDVEAGVTYGAAAEFTGTFVSPAVTDVEAGVTYGAAAEFTGTCAVPAAADVEFGVAVNATTGTFAVPLEADVEVAVTYGAAAEFTGTLAVPLEADVEAAVTYGAAAEFTGTCAVPAAADVEFGVAVNATTGTFVVPAVGDVEAAVTFGAATEFTGTFVVPAEVDVRIATTYGDTAEFTGTLAAIGAGLLIT